MLEREIQHGMTLIELLVAMAVLAILISLAAGGYQTWIQNQQIRTSAESILNGLQTARSEAVTSNLRVRFVLCDLPNSAWEILASPEVVGASAVAPAASLVCSGSDAAAGDQRIQEKSGQEGASGNVTVSATLTDGTGVNTATVGALATVTFNGLGRVVANTNGTAPILQVDVDNPNGDRPLRVTQATGGAVRLCDPSPLLAATDPRHC